MYAIEIETNLPHKPEDLFDELCRECGVNKSWFGEPKKIRRKRDWLPHNGKDKYSKTYKWYTRDSGNYLYPEKRLLIATFLRKKAVEGFTNYSSW